ncbi:MAG: zinc ribbon domain-containing protein [Candidatus Paceibacterota bacterium]|jgi:hypothetical protein
MNCIHCNNDLTDDINFCSKCGTKVQKQESTKVLEKVKTNTVRGTRIILGVFSGLLVFAIVFKLLVFLITIISLFLLGGFGVDISGSTETVANVDAIANILALIISAILANKTYILISRKNTNTKNNKS